MEVTSIIALCSQLPKFICATVNETQVAQDTHQRKASGAALPKLLWDSLTCVLLDLRLVASHPTPAWPGLNDGVVIPAVAS
jgi:hypothetical protein